MMHALLIACSALAELVSSATSSTCAGYRSFESAELIALGLIRAIK